MVVDFGLATDAPAHETPPAGVVPGCVYVHDGDTGADVLAAAAAVRIGTGSDAGLVCGIDGYPKTECAVAVATHAPPRLTPSAHPPTPPAATARHDGGNFQFGPNSDFGVADDAWSRRDQQGLHRRPPQRSQSPRAAVCRSCAGAAHRHSRSQHCDRARGHRNGVTATTIVGIALIAALGAGSALAHPQRVRR